jgi:thiamine pyrophosphate-dependent acetolactate synthase large subunit-like protein
VEVQMNGGDLVGATLETQGVQYVFTLCGGHISPILVGAKRRGVRVIDVRDEKNAVFAADAVARLTGVPGVAAVTAGPGLTNTITAVQNAKMAESPVVLLGGATATVLRGRGSLQDIDQVALMAPSVKRVEAAKSVRGLGRKLGRAFAAAREGVPGPAFVEAPVDLLYEEETVREWYEKESGGNGTDLGSRVVQLYLRQHLFRQFAGARSAAPAALELPSVAEASAREIQSVAALVREARQPVLVIGSQALLEPQAVDALAHAVIRLGIPVFLGGMARGLLGADCPLQFRHQRSKALKKADLVLIAGFPMDFRLGYGLGINRRAKLVTVNRDPAQVTKNRKPTLGITGDPGRFLRQLADAVKPGPWEGWTQQLRDAERARDAEIDAQATQVVDGLVNPIHLSKRLDAAVADDSVFVVDGGDFVATAAYVVRPRRPLSWLDPGVFGTLGVGAGFAMAAQLVRPQAEVWLLYGDGAAAYSIAEFDTFVRHELPVIAVVGNNASWQQIARDQTEILKDDVGTVLRRTDYHQVAEGYGAKGLVLRAPDEVDDVLAEAKRLRAAGHPVLINAWIKDTEFRKGSISM